MKRTVVAVALMSIGLTAAHAQEMVVKLGGAAPLTGNQSHLGKDLENGTRLAIEEANAKGVTIGGRSNSSSSARTTRPTRAPAPRWRSDWWMPG